jgi:V-type H+-transporting ATPase subunit a
MINCLAPSNVGKTGFLYTFSGPDDGPLSNKLRILINQCEARLYPLPRNSNDLLSKLIKVQKENDDAHRILSSSVKNLEDFSKELSSMENNTGTSRFNRIKGKLIFISNVLETLTKFKNSQNFMEGKFWLPESGQSYVEDALYILSQRKDLGGFRVVPETLKKSSKPPTKFKKNELLHQYQKIVDTYGIPRYKEINPAVITSVSFPFLFGLMFGDIAHGFILFLFGLFVFLKGRSIADSLRIEHLEMRSLGVLLFMMGFFAVYAGLVYNDFLALPVTIANSCYKIQNDKYGIPLFFFSNNSFDIS